MKIAISKSRANTAGQKQNNAHTVTMTNTPAVATMSNVNNAGGTFIAKLNVTKHNLLRAHQGCFRCRVFYVGHYSPDCPLAADVRPSAEACKNITLANAMKAKAVFEKMIPATVVGAVFEADSESNLEFGDEEIDEYIPKVI